ncbi:hypothetical protein [uncultured Desulfovibrio sp.]|uniref:hypothetical protein n=1 Tax=uncultured Desulfovibrio sp. TaxID=167968 RepID=UPI0027121D16|nr:hypothetical protein [uncultured Desulfovibrio sp.]
MANKVLAPILAGIGLGWLAFSPEGQKMAKGVGQTIMPALMPGKEQDEPLSDKDVEDEKFKDELKHKEGEA